MEGLRRAASASSWRRRPASTTKLISRSAVEEKDVDAGLRRHDGFGVDRSKPASLGIRGAKIDGLWPALPTYGLARGVKEMKRQRFDDVFDAICDTPEEAENLKLRANLMRELANRIAGMSQQEAAILLGVTQPRVCELVCGKINFFRLISWSTWRRGPVLM